MDYTVTQGLRNLNPPGCDLSAEKNSATVRATTLSRLSACAADAD
ncbi:hypothetical protein [Pantoea sp. B65]